MLKQRTFRPGSARRMQTEVRNKAGATFIIPTTGASLAVRTIRLVLGNETVMTPWGSIAATVHHATSGARRVISALMAATLAIGDYNMEFQIPIAAGPTGAGEVETFMHVLPFRIDLELPIDLRTD